MSDPVIGKGLDRVDARQKVTGTATYAAEVPVANVVHAVIVGAPRIGTLSHIDIADARRVPGVIAVITHENAPRVAAKKTTETDKVLQLLQENVVHYSDQPIAVVVADTLERAHHAASLVAPQYRATPPVTIQLADGDIYAPHQAGPRGDTDSSRGEPAAAFASAPVKVDATYTTPNETHNPMEMHATIAVWHGDDVLTLYDSTQGIFGVRQRLAAIFDIPKENVRVIDHFVGGGFGSKGSPWSHVGLAALAAKVAGRPVKLMVTRPQMFSLVGHRPLTRQHLQLGADRKGKLVAIRHEVLSETSRFDEFCEPAALPTRILYACPNVATQHRLSRLDVSTPTFTRAPGEASGSFALESAMDELAYAVGIDPLQLRILNHADRDEHENKPYSSKSLLACYQQAAERFGWAKRRHAPRSMRDSGALVGWGMASATYPARQLPSSAIARLRPDGTLLVQSGTQDLGTGTYTVMTQLAADTAGVPYDRVRFELGDTAFPEAPLSVGSFTVSSTGSAVKTACVALVKALVALAIEDPKSPLHGVPAADIVARDGALVAGSKRDELADIVTRSGHPEIAVERRNLPNGKRDRYSCHAFGAVFAEVHVDEDLGRIRATRIVAAYGSGKIMNAKTATSQLAGGIVWSIGMALTEIAERDPRTARVVTRDLADYHVPACADVPPIDIILLDERDDIVNEIGAKGLGEIGNVGASAAIANAVYHATGKRIRDLPITLDKLIG